MEKLIIRRRANYLFDQETKSILPFVDKLSGVTEIPKKKILPVKRPISWIPTPMTRTSPFFPTSDRDAKKLESVKIQLETKWGKMSQEGEKLSTYDEGVLLLLLYLVDRYKASSFRTSYYELTGIAGIGAAPSNYTAIQKSIRKLAKTYVEVKTELYEMGGTIISLWGIDKSSRHIGIRMNDAIFPVYSAGTGLTNLDLRFRLSLKGEIAKAIYRFLSGQKPFHKYREYHIGLVKLCDVINLPIKQLYIAKRDVNRALKELHKSGFLSSYHINDKKVVSMSKGTISKPSRKERKVKELEHKRQPNNDEEARAIEALANRWIKYKGQESYSLKEWNDCVEAVEGLIGFAKRMVLDRRYWESGNVERFLEMKKYVQLLKSFNLIEAIELDRGNYTKEQVHSGWLKTDKGMFDRKEGRLIKWLKQQGVMDE